MNFLIDVMRGRALFLKKRRRRERAREREGERERWGRGVVEVQLSVVAVERSACFYARMHIESDPMCVRT